MFRKSCSEILLLFTAMKKYSLEGRKHPSFIYSVLFSNKFRHEKELQHKHIKCLFYLKKGNIALWENSKLLLHFCLVAIRIYLLRSVTSLVMKRNDVF